MTLPACLIPPPPAPIQFLDLRHAHDLRPGDIVRLPGIDTDLIEVEVSPCGLVRLRWSVDDADVMIVGALTAFVVLVRMPC